MRDEQLEGGPADKRVALLKCHDEGAEDAALRKETKRKRVEAAKGCEEKHTNTTAHHPVVKPPVAASKAGTVKG